MQASKIICLISKYAFAFLFLSSFSLSSMQDPSPQAPRVMSSYRQGPYKIAPKTGTILEILLKKMDALKIKEQADADLARHAEITRSMVNKLKLQSEFPDSPLWNDITNVSTLHGVCFVYFVPNSELEKALYPGIEVCSKLARSNVDPSVQVEYVQEAIKQYEEGKAHKKHASDDDDDDESGDEAGCCSYFFKKKKKGD